MAKFLRRKTQESGSVSQNTATETLFSTKLLNSNIETVALTRAPENVGENQDKSCKAPFTLRLAGEAEHPVCPACRSNFQPRK